MGQKRYTAEQIIGKLRQAEVRLSKRRLELPELLTQLYLRNLRYCGVREYASCAICAQKRTQLAQWEACSTFLRIRRLGIRIPPGACSNLLSYS
ncbi:MAG: hypothetical protein V3R87_12835 [Dehalococcoidia bacterium]